MGTTAQVQQSAIVENSRFISCTPHLQGWRYYKHFADFQEICGDKASDASALRGFETMTNTRIRELRHFYDIPGDHLPHEDDLWIEASGYGMEEWNIGIYKHATYDYCFVSLIERGFLYRRFVAYPGRYLLDPVNTAIYQDLQGNSFIIVDDDAGNYMDDQGEQCNAKDQGYTVIRRQYKYCIDAINAALAKLAGQSPPASMPRWHALQRKSVTGETTKSTPGNAQSTSSQTSVVNQGGLSNDEESTNPSLLFENKNNINYSELSSNSSKKLLSIIGSQQLRSTPWTPDTLIALSAYHLAVPDPDEIDNDQWQRDWAEPALWLIDFTAHLDCTRAWEDIELFICAMIAGPTWHARKASKPFVSYGTLRHVVGWNKETGELDGHNWKSTAQALEKERWKDYEHIEYSGPPLFDELPAQSSYAQGYTAQAPVVFVESTAQAVEVVAQSPSDDDQTAQFVEVVEVTAQSLDTAQNDDCASDLEDSAQPVETAQSAHDTEELVSTAQSEGTKQIEEAAQSVQGEQGMSWRRADALIAMIAQDSPMIRVKPKKLNSELYLVGIEIALNQWFYFDNIIDWSAPLPATQRVIAQAEYYGQQRLAADGSTDSQGPPGAG